jgi:spore cortex formation protein SpoVR/YcgB (stage V sporulation)
LGVVLACSSAARSGLPSPERVPRRAKNAFRRRAAARRGAASVARRESVSPRLLDLARAFEIRAGDDDFGFVRNHLTQELAEELKLFRYEQTADGSVRVLDHDIHALRESVLGPKYNFGAPAVLAKHLAADGSLELYHEHDTDGRGLDVDRAERVLDYMHKVWRRPISLETVDGEQRPKVITRS